MERNEPNGCPEAARFLGGGGEMGRLIRAHDWAATPLGPPAGWPSPLKTALRVILNSGHPMYIWWGPELRCFYNDAYRRSIGPERHPGSLGRPGREVWDEIWPIIGPQIDQVMAGRGATWHENQLVPITRNGQREDVYWTYSYGPIDDETAAAGVGGVLVVCSETTEHVLQHQQSAAERERLRQMFEQAPGFMALLSGPEHRFDLANPAYLKLIGDREMVGKTVAEALPEAIEQGYVELLDRVFRSGEAYRATGARFTFQEASGGDVVERFVDFVYQPLCGEDGRPVGIFVEGVDVTDRTRGEAALRESEEQLRLATEAAEVGLWDVDIESDTLFWPARVKAMFGISADIEVSMADFYAGLHPDDRERTSSAFAAAVDPRRRALYDVEYRTVGKEDEVVRWVAAKGRGHFDGDGRCLRVIGTAVDITARKRIEAELRELNETLEQRVEDALAERSRLAQIVEKTDVFIQVVDTDFRFIAINKASADEFERIFGIRPKSGDSMLELLADRPEHRESVREIWSRALGGEAFTAIDEFGDGAFDRRYYEMKFNPLRDAAGNIVGAYQFVYDVTDRLRDQARLAEAEEALRQSQKMEAMGQLTGGVAHDFNNLLTPIIGSLDLLRRRGVGDEREQRLIEGAFQSADRAKTLVQRLLAFARRQPLQPRAVDVAALVEGIAELVDSTSGPRVRVELDIAGDLPSARADANQLEMAILNLSVNARDAMPDGGILTVAAREQEVGSGHAAKVGPGRYVRLSVADTGIGMDETTLASAVDPFFSTKGIGKGTGLGLSMVHGLVSQLGGDLVLSSRPGVGTVAELWLPVADGKATRSEEIAADASVTATGTVLLVDDEELVRMSTATMLLDLGFNVVEAESGEQALRMIGDGVQADILITDHLMPGMTGTELARTLREARPEVKVLIISGYAEADGIAPDLPRLTKPFRYAELAHHLALEGTQPRE